MTLAKPAYKRILLKLSGEALMGEDAFGINRDTIVRMVEEIAEITRLGVEVAVVIGGGNIFRGVAGGSVGMDRATADYMGMLATVMNALALADTMNKAEEAVEDAAGAVGDVAEDAADAMATIFSNHRNALTFGKRLDGVANIA